MFYIVLRSNAGAELPVLLPRSLTILSTDVLAGGGCEAGVAASNSATAPARRIMPYHMLPCQPSLPSTTHVKQLLKGQVAELAAPNAKSPAASAGV